MSPPNDFLERMAQIEWQIQALDGLADAGAREAARTLVHSVLQLHTTGMARILELLREAGAAGQAMRDSLAGDALVSSLLTLHDLHPVELGARLQQVLQQMQPLLDAHGSKATIDRAENGMVRIILTAPGANGRPAALVVKQALEAAIFEAAPDVIRVEFVEPGAARVSLPVIPIPGKVTIISGPCSR